MPTGRPELRQVAGELARFCTVGVGNTLLTLAVYTALLHVGVPYLVASALGFCAGAVNGFVLNRAWTFRAEVGWTAAAGYVGVQLAGLALDVLLVAAFVDGLGWGKLVGQVVALPLVTVTTFTLARSLVFRRRRARSDDGATRTPA